jgi:hypothetical protein
VRSEGGPPTAEMGSGLSALGAKALGHTLRSSVCFPVPFSMGNFGDPTNSCHFLSRGKNNSDPHQGNLGPRLRWGGGRCSGAVSVRPVLRGWTQNTRKYFSKIRARRVKILNQLYLFAIKSEAGAYLSSILTSGGTRMTLRGTATHLR